MTEPLLPLTDAARRLREHPPSARFPGKVGRPRTRLLPSEPSRPLDDVSSVPPERPAPARTSSAAVPGVCPQLVNVREAAACLRVSQDGVRTLIADGQLPVVRLGGLRRVLIDLQDLAVLIAQSKART